MQEIWKYIKGYENIYMISTYGEIKSVKDNKVIKPIKLNNGYLIVGLSNNGIVSRIPVHRLVANTFINNINKLPEINHKNEIKTDNRVENLEFCSCKYNCNYGTRNKRIADKLKRKVTQYTVLGEKVQIWDSIKSASEILNINSGNICNCCQNKRKTAGNYIWKYCS